MANRQGGDALALDGKTVRGSRYVGVTVTRDLDTVTLLVAGPADRPAAHSQTPLSSSVDLAALSRNGNPPHSRGTRHNFWGQARVARLRP